MIGMVFWLHTKWAWLYDLRFLYCLYRSLHRLDDSDPFEKEVKEYRLRHELALRTARSMGVRHIRTNISWAEGDTPNGPDLQRWHLGQLHGAGFHILANFNYVPQSLADVNHPTQHSTNVLPKDKDLDGLGKFITETKSRNPFLESVEIWNEPDLKTDLDPACDPDGKRFVKMVNVAAERAKELGLQTTMGGICHDINWYERFCRLGGLRNMDRAGWHCLLGTWSYKEKPLPWLDQVSRIEWYTNRYSGKDIPVVLSEVGYPTVDFRKNGYSQSKLEQVQAATYADMSKQLNGHPLPTYWYSLFDMQKSVPSVRKETTGWEDNIQNHFGCCDENGKPKLLAKLLMSGGAGELEQFVTEKKLGALSGLVIKRGTPKEIPASEFQYLKSRGEASNHPQQP